MAEANKVQAADAKASAASGGKTVTVACKLPNGMVLQLCNMVDTTEYVMGGGTRTVKVAHRVGPQVRIHGCATPFGATPRLPIEGSYALTHGVDADFWAAWLEQHKNDDVVRNGLLFAHERPDYAADKAKEQVDVRSGLEPLDPSKLPRTSLNPNLSNVETSDVKSRAA